MTTQQSNRGLLTAGGLSAGLVFVGEAFGVPLLPVLGTLVGLLVLGVATLEELLIGDGPVGAETDRNRQRRVEQRPNRHFSGSVTALLVASGIIITGLMFEVRPLVVLGSLLGLAVVGGLATFGVLASAAVPNGGESAGERG